MSDRNDMQGEGNYDAARDYNRATTAHASDTAAVEREAREAADALDDYGAALDRAEAAGREGEPVEEIKNQDRPLTEDEKADVGSLDSMDASDPSSATQPGGGNPANGEPA